MNSIYYPFGSLQEVYTLLFLSYKLDDIMEMDLITSIFNSSLKTAYGSEVLKLGIFKAH